MRVPILSTADDTPRRRRPTTAEDWQAELTEELIRQLVRIRGVRLRVTGGVDAGLTLASEAERIVVGTHPTVDLVLHDPTTSRFHCELVAREGTVIIRDLGSRNGVVVNGVKILEAEIFPGVVIALGGTRLQLEVGADPLCLPVSARDRFGVMVGVSPLIRRAFFLLERAARSDATVLLGGETGTGKEAAAHSIHLESARRDGPFVVVDCASLPPSLLESELFGHERGAFTGATSDRVGAFRAASGGTVFLDEIGELTVDLQPKLLRVLESREVKRLGSERRLPIDVRVIAATNRSLRSEVTAGRFRSDLYYRLAVLEIDLPPLRERPDDLAALVETMVTRSTTATQLERDLVLRPEFLATLSHHGWPGNVRELRNYIDRCLAMAEQPPLEPADAPSAADALPAIDTACSLREGRDRWIAAYEIRYLNAILAEHRGNVTAAARAAKVDRVQLYRLLWRHGLR